MNDPQADITRFSGPSFYTRVQLSNRMVEASFFILIMIVDMIFKVGKLLYKVFYLLKIIITDLNIASTYYYFYLTIFILINK